MLLPVFHYVKTRYGNSRNGICRNDCDPDVPDTLKPKAIGSKPNAPHLAAALDQCPNSSHDMSMAPHTSYVAPLVELREDEFERRTLEGVSWSEVVHLAHELKLSLSEVARVVGIPSSSFFSRKGKRFSKWPSEKILRYDRLLKLGEKVFGNGAASWLVAPNPYLGGATPLNKAKTEAGARQVELLMMRINYGLG